ncbi:MAG: AAA family ATPase [Candidatus Heimdallarchaeota archaeon]|nr:AAA family ATPase [Candidatus Heimdallarchaeota archaeon]MCK4953735.1 AAA family ATPase [Candidatus Heimdallarchaeota archaeon]
MAELPIIAVSGPHGSGKTTAAREIADFLGYKYISAGERFRNLAQKEGLNLEDFSKAAELNEKIDRQIDEYTLEIAKKGGNLVIDAQLGGWVLYDIADLIVYVTAPLDLRIKRIAERENKDIGFIRKETLARENSEKQRYQKLYNIDITDLSIYDIIINSQKFDASDCVRIIKTAFEKISKGD